MKSAVDEWLAIYHNVGYDTHWGSTVQEWVRRSVCQPWECRWCWPVWGRWLHCQISWLACIYQHTYHCRPVTIVQNLMLKKFLNNNNSTCMCMVIMQSTPLILFMYDGTRVTLSSWNLGLGYWLTRYKKVSGGTEDSRMKSCFTRPSDIMCVRAWCVQVYVYAFIH